MDAHQTKWNETIAAKVAERLAARRMEGSYAAGAAQAVQEILAMIPDGATVYRCGSTTTAGLGLWEALGKRTAVKVINPFEPGIEREEALRRRRQGFSADFMIASSNAVTMDGELVNLDGTGNRVAAITFGPAKVILVVGMNKVVTDVEAAMERIKRYTAPVNARRIGADTPCAKSGECEDCDSPKRTCNAWSIIEGQAVQGRIHVKLVGENLGY